jgi:hypothetical protein
MSNRRGSISSSRRGSICTINNSRRGSINKQSNADIALIGSSYAAWGNGVYHLGEHGGGAITEHIHPDYVVDASASVKNTDMFKVYGGVGKGHAGFKDWITRLKDFDFIGK